MAAERWDFGLASHGAPACSSSEQGANVAANAIDGNDATYWNLSISLR